MVKVLLWNLRLCHFLPQYQNKLSLHHLAPFSVLELLSVRKEAEPILSPGQKRLKGKNP